MTPNHYLTKPGKIKPPSQAGIAPIQRVERFKLPILLTILHIPLGIAFYRVGALGLIHQLAVLALGLYWAVRKDTKIERVAWVAVYIVGAEVLWRMSQTSIFYEFGKYGAAMIMIVALVQRGYTKIPLFPLLYFIFLIPACFIVLMDSSLGGARDRLSFNMSGPFLLFISCWFFSHVKIGQPQLKRFFLLFTVPLVSVAVTTLFYTVTAEQIKFTGESNFSTSGGFGPNQVSATLGLGAFICMSIFLLFKNDSKTLLYLGVLTILFTAQSVMTFSRGGMYAAIGAALAVLFFQLKNLGKNMRKILPIIGIALIFLLLVFPRLDSFTGGKLGERFESSDSTNRVEIIKSDLRLFMERPVFGIGVGQAKYYRAKYVEFQAASHTEFTRIISEHGMFGVFSLIVLVLATIFNLRRQKTNFGKAFVIGVVAWSTLFMMNTGMRLAAPAIMWGLSFMTILMPRSPRPRKRIKRPTVPEKPRDIGRTLSRINLIGK